MLSLRARNTYYYHKNYLNTLSGAMQISIYYLYCYLKECILSSPFFFIFNAAEETTLSCFDFQLSDNLLHLGSKPHTLDTHFSSEALDVQSWARKPKCSTTEPALSQQGPDPESQNPRNLIRVSH